MHDEPARVRVRVGVRIRVWVRVSLTCMTNWHASARAVPPPRAGISVARAAYSAECDSGFRAAATRACAASSARPSVRVQLSPRSSVRSQRAPSTC